MWAWNPEVEEQFVNPRLGLSDAEIHAITLYIGLRIAYSTVNDALDVPLDLQLVDTFPDEVVETVDFARA